VGPEVRMPLNSGNWRAVNEALLKEEEERDQGQASTRLSAQWAQERNWGRSSSWRITETLSRTSNVLLLLFVIFSPGACVYAMQYVLGDGGCGKSRLVYEGCGTDHWWVPLYLMCSFMAGIAAYGAQVNSHYSWPDIPRILNYLHEGVQREPPKLLEVSGSQREVVNGMYDLIPDTVSQSMPTWQKQGSDLQLVSDLTDWMIAGKETGFCAHVLRHHHGRMPHEYDGCWRCKELVEEGEGSSLIVMDRELVVTIAGEGEMSPQRSGHRYYRGSERICLALAIGLLAPVCQVYVHTLMNQFLDKSSFMLPEEIANADELGNSQITVLIKICACVLVDGSVILAPFTYTLGGVLTLQFANVVYHTITDIYQNGWRKFESVGAFVSWAGKCQWQAMVSPSWASMAVMTFFNLGHVLLLLAQQMSPLYHGEIGVYGAYRNVYLHLVNSGSMTLYVTCIYGSLLTLVYFDAKETGATVREDYPHISKGAGLRIVIGYILFCIKLPIMVTHIWWAMAKWWWLAIPAEACLSALLEVFLPEASQASHAFLVRRRCWRQLQDNSTSDTAQTTFQSISPWLQYLVVLSLLPLHEPVALIARVIGLSTPSSKLTPGKSAMLLGVFLTVKAVELQYFFSLQIFTEFGVSYLDAVPLGYEARHLACDSCLFTQYASKGVQMTGSFFALFMLQFLTYIFS